MHNNRATREAWKRLDLLIVHATSSTLWIQDLNLSPFNVGERLRLAPFELDHVVDLNGRHDQPLHSDAEMERLLELLGGQPYLVRQAFHALVTSDWGLPDLEREATRDGGPFGDHLRQQIAVLRRDEQRLRSLKQVLRNGSCENEEDFEGLLAAGLVRGESRRSVKPACELYRAYFQEHL